MTTAGMTTAGNNHGAIRELVKQAPSAVAIILVIVLFLRFERERLETLNVISDQCHATSISITESMAAALDKTSDAVERNTEAMVKVALLLERVESRLEQ